MQPNHMASISRGLQALLPRAHRQNWDVFSALREGEGDVGEGREVGEVHALHSIYPIG